LTVNCTLDVAVLVEGLPVGLIGDDPSHVHVIVASGLPPFMSHVRIIVEIWHHTVWTTDITTGHTLDVRCK
jgi:hypothetical protein